MADYSKQGRGDLGAYTRYLAGMDATMRQKVALTAAFLLGRGHVADMGMGSGAGSHALAALYPRLTVTGVDVNPTMVALAEQRYALPNLRFRAGDIAAPLFPPASLDGIFDSSVLHHVTSFGGYDYDNAGRCLAVQAEALGDHGMLVVRDFVDPGRGEVLLDVPADDGDDSDDPRTCSTAALLRRTARELRSLHETPGFPLVALSDAPRPGWLRFRLAHTHAVEFVLRKDYRKDWKSEIQEEYTYYTQEEFEALFAQLGLRLLCSTPLHTPWIVRNRFVSRFELRCARTSAPLDWPATNYVIVGEKVPAGEGVRFRDAGDAPALGFLEATTYRNRLTGERRDLVRRPNATVDVLPFFRENGELFVLARASYPRPILATTAAQSGLCGSHAGHYVTEPLTVVQRDHPLGATVEAALVAAGFTRKQLLSFYPGGHYYPSPGGTEEEVRSVLVEVASVLVQSPSEPRSGFSTSGRLRAIEAQQALRAAQVGGLPDARLELNVYALCAMLGHDVGPWIGEAITLRDRGSAADPGPVTSLRTLAARPRRRVFDALAPQESAGFLQLRTARFEELDAKGTVVASKVLELVAPRTRSNNTVALALLWRRGDVVYLGVDDDDLPAAQCFNGNSQLIVAPAWRLPHGIASLTPARTFVRERVASEYGLCLGDVQDLGGRYFPSPGLSAEVVYPMACEVLAPLEGPVALRSLLFVPLSDTLSGKGAGTAATSDVQAEVRDGHLQILARRAAHALGLFS